MFLLRKWTKKVDTEPHVIPISNIPFSKQFFKTGFRVTPKSTVPAVSLVKFLDGISSHSLKLSKFILSFLPYHVKVLMKKNPDFKCCRNIFCSDLYPPCHLILWYIKANITCFKKVSKRLCMHGKFCMQKFREPRKIED